MVTRLLVSRPAREVGRAAPDPVTPRATGAAFGAGAGLGSALLVDLWCPVSYLPHLFLGHLLPIGVLALLGGVLGSRLLRLAWR